MEIKSLTCWTEPLHFQLPPTKNLRASRDDVEWMARLAAAAALADAEEASLAAELESMMKWFVANAITFGTKEMKCFENG